MSSNTISFIKVSINIAMTILIVAASYIIINFDKQNKELNKINDDLAVLINEKENIIIELNQDIESLNADITNLKIINNKLKNDNEDINNVNNGLLIEIEELESKINELEKSKIVTPTNNDFKSYLPYDAITNTISRQWELQQQATTNEDGIRCIDGIPLVAVGTGWGLKVGDTALVICENGNSFKVMIGDIKADIHTDEENKTTVFSNCRCEFIVELDKLDPEVKSMGNVAILSKYSGYVVNVEKIG